MTPPFAAMIMSVRADAEWLDIDFALDAEWLDGPDLISGADTNGKFSALMSANALVASAMSLPYSCRYVAHAERRRERNFEA